MQRMGAIGTAAVLVMFAAGVDLSAQSPVVRPGVGTVTVTGRVTDRAGKPVANARVYAPGTGAAARSEANGNYVLANVPGGPQSVVVRARGYAPARVEAKFSTKPSDRARNHINVTLATPGEALAQATQRSADSVGLENVGFYQRQGTVSGAYFITPDDIQRMRPNRVSDIFRGVPIINEVPGRFGPVLRGAQGCLLLYVDGLPWRSMFAGDLDADIQARDVAAAEVYPPGFPAPAPFFRASTRRSCTTAAVWTRSRFG